MKNIKIKLIEYALKKAHKIEKEIEIEYAYYGLPFEQYINYMKRIRKIKNEITDMLVRLQNE